MTIQYMELIPVQIVLVSLTIQKDSLSLVGLKNDEGLPVAPLHKGQEPDHVAGALAESVTGTRKHLERHAFMPKSDTGQDVLCLIYCQMVPYEDVVAGGAMPDIPYGEDAVDLPEPWQRRVLQRVVRDVRDDLRSVMKASQNKKGLVRLLNLLPDIFDRKELSAAYMALSGDKPPSSVMLARMMLDSYTMGSGDKARTVQGRNLISEYDAPTDELINMKLEKNKDLYSTGGPKAKRLYKKT